MSDELPQLAYSIPSLARACDISVNGVRNEMRAGRLNPVYFGTKPLFPLPEAQRWLDSLPSQKTGASKSSEDAAA
jgi:hypothetical protein